GQTDRRALARPEGPRPAGGHAGDLLRRVWSDELLRGADVVRQLRPGPPATVRRTAAGRRRLPGRFPLRRDPRVGLGRGEGPRPRPRPASDRAARAGAGPPEAGDALPGPRLPADGRGGERGEETAGVGGCCSEGGEDAHSRLDACWSGDFPRVPY